MQNENLTGCHAFIALPVPWQKGIVKKGIVKKETVKKKQ